MFNIGDRVRMVQTNSCGTIASAVQVGAGVDGSDRISIKWDKTGHVNQWNPGFLRTADTKESDDPDEVIVGKVGRRRRSVKFQNGMAIVTPEGFFAVENKPCTSNA